MFSPKMNLIFQSMQLVMKFLQEESNHSLGSLTYAHLRTKEQHTDINWIWPSKAPSPMRIAPLRSIWEISGVAKLCIYVCAILLAHTAATMTKVRHLHLTTGHNWSQPLVTTTTLEQNYWPVGQVGFGASDSVFSRWLARPSDDWWWGTLPPAKSWTRQT